MKLSFSSLLLLVLFAGAVVLIGYQEFKINYGGILPYIKAQSANLPGFKASSRRDYEAPRTEAQGPRYRLKLPGISEVRPPMEKVTREDEEQLESLLEER